MAILIYLLIVLIAVLLLLFNKKLLLYYFVFLYPILPEYLAANITASMPLFTVSRMLLIVLVLSLMTNRWVRLRINISKTFTCAFVLYLLCYGISTYANIGDADTIKAFIGIVLENVILTIVFLSIVDNREKLLGCLYAILLGSGVVFVLGISEPITKLNIASEFLDIGARDTILINTYERYNTVRAVFSFGHAIALGVYCTAVLPIVMWFYSVEKKMKYAILFCAGALCLLMTMSRGVLAAFALVMIISLIIYDERERSVYIKIFSVIIISSFFMILFVPDLFSVAKNTILGTFNAFGTKFAVDSTGGNEDALLSRFSQFTMIPQVLKGRLFFGGGQGYIHKNPVLVYLQDRAFTAKSIDIEYLSMLIDYGVVGLVGGIGLYFSTLKITWNDYKINSDRLSLAFFQSFLGIYISYFTVAQLTTGRILWVLIALYLCHLKLKQEDDYYV